MRDPYSDNPPVFQFKERKISMRTQFCMKMGHYVSTLPKSTGVRKPLQMQPSGKDTVLFGSKAAQSFEERIRENQVAVTRLEQQFPQIVESGEPAILQALAQYAVASEGMSVQSDKSKIDAALRSKGYKPNDALGLPRSEYEKPAVLARLIIGQFLSREILHAPTVVGAVEEYNKLPR